MKTELSIEHLYMQAASHFVAGFEESNFAEGKFVSNFICCYKKGIEVEISYAVRMEKGIVKSISLDVCTDFEDELYLMGSPQVAKQQAIHWINTFLTVFHCEIYEGYDILDILSDNEDLRTAI